MLAAAAARDSLPQSLLIHGPRGVGKQRLALWIAQLVMCEAEQARPCGTCGACRMVLSLEHPDVHWYFPLPRPKGVSGDRLGDALEDARVEALAAAREKPLRVSHSDEVRGLYLGTVKNIRKRAHMRASIAGGPIFIIGEADLLVPQEASPEAANALLKLLEEPPGHARFMLTSSEPGRLLPTIRSRTVPVHVGAVDNDTVAGFLEHEAGTEPRHAAWAAVLSQGSIGRALGFLPDGDDLGPLEELRRQAFDLVAGAFVTETSRAFEIALAFGPTGARKLLDLFAFVEEWLRDLGAVAAGAPERAINRDSVERLRSLVEDACVSPSDVPLAFPIVENAREQARGNVNPQLVVNGLVRGLRRVLMSAQAAETAP